MRAPLAVPLALLLACGGGDDSSGPPEPPPPLQQSPAPLQWTWIPIEGAVCSDGSPTGIGLELGPGAAPDVLVFLMGGGACWDALTCFPPFGLRQLATPGPYGEADLDEDVRTLRPGSILDRALPGNPYRDFTFVLVPYCTGDVHAGDAVQRYPLAPRDWHHRGRANLRAGFAHLSAALAPPSRVVVSGSSAGGFGALLAFELAKGAWPSVRGYLVDDSGPPLDAIPDVTVAAWYLAWDLGAAVNAVCGLEQALACAEDLGRVFPALAARYPADRFALLSSTQDATMRVFFGTFTQAPPFVTEMSAAEFEASLRRLAASMEDDVPPGETHAFVVPGTAHPMLDRPASFASQGVALVDWLRQMVDDDPAWGGVVPPP